MPYQSVWRFLRRGRPWRRCNGAPHNPNDRDALLTRRDAIALPAEQIAAGQLYRRTGENPFWCRPFDEGRALRSLHSRLELQPDRLAIFPASPLDEDAVKSMVTAHKTMGE